MITTLETNAIKSFLLKSRGDKSTFWIDADHTSMKISKSTHLLLDWYCAMYREGVNKPRMGKGAIIHVLLKKFALDQKAIFSIEKVDLKEYNSSMLKALQEAKRIFAGYCKEKITTQDNAVVAILIYSIIRDFEELNGLKITNYTDDEFEGGDIESEHKPEPEPEPIPVIQPILISPDNGKKEPNLIDLDDLFEETPLPTDFLRRGK